MRALIEPLGDGTWRLIVRRREVEIFESREEAVQALNEMEGET